MEEVIKKSNLKFLEEIYNNYFATATDLADYLVIEKKIPFRDL